MLQTKNKLVFECLEENPRIVLGVRTPDKRGNKHSNAEKKKKIVMVQTPPRNVQTYRGLEN